MSGQIQLESAAFGKDIEAHVLPCHIAYDGPSKVSQFFKARANPADESASTTYFRGRKLCGRTVPLPENYTGRTSKLETEF
jgi:ribonuclease H2 subunit C